MHPLAIKRLERVVDKRRRQLLLARKKILQQARIKRSTLLYTHMPEMEESRRDALGRRKDTRPEEKGDVPVGNGTAACFFEFSLLISVYQTTPDMPRKATGLFDSGPFLVHRTLLSLRSLRAPVHQFSIFFDSFRLCDLALALLPLLLLGH